MPQTDCAPPRRIKVEGTVFDILEARPLARGIKLFVIKAPRIARKQRPGQFVIIRLDEYGERIPPVSYTHLTLPTILLV